jgi:probable HAF family extracellular repeat protein
MHSIKKIYTSLVAFTAACLSLHAQAPQYNVTIIAKINNNKEVIQAEGLNNLGQVVGWWTLYGADSVFIYFNGTTTNVPNPKNYPGCVGLGINNNNEFVGNCPVGRNTDAVIYMEGEGYVNLGGQGQAGAMAINNAGQIVGYTEPSSTQHAAIFFMNGTVLDLGTLEGPGGVSQATSINDNYGADGFGQIIGWSTSTEAPSKATQGQAFLYVNGVMNNIGQSICPNMYSKPTDINSKGQITGSCMNGTDTSNAIAFVYNSANGEVEFLEAQAAYGINNAGWIIGAGYSVGPFLIINGEMYNLFDLIPPDPSFVQMLPLAINDQGQILVKTNAGPAFLTPIQ